MCVKTQHLLHKKTALKIGKREMLNMKENLFQTNN